MTTTKKFNTYGPIRSELSSESEREAKIQEFESRGYRVKRLYEREVNYIDRVASGYKHVPLRNVGSHGRVKYGLIVERVEG